MSRPANPLSTFRSYSYYHVLVMCDSSETADTLAKESKPEKWLHPNAPNPNLGTDDSYGELGPYAVKYTDEQQKKGRYCVLINGATDATFTITDAKWYSVTGGAVTMADQATSIAVEGSLDISEPKGVVFLDLIVTCSLALGVDASNVVYLLKTFFVGHPDKDNVSIQDSYITDIEPIRFIAYDVSASFAETGGMYQISFVALNHGASRLPQYGKSATGFNFTAAGTLAKTFQRLADVVNQNYEAFFHCVYTAISRAEGVSVDPDFAQFSDKSISSLLDRVEYEFCLHPEYATDVYKVVDQAVQAKTKTGCADEAQVSLSANTSIEDAIHKIMRMSPQVMDDMGLKPNGEPKSDDASGGPKVRYEYKVHTGVESKRDESGKIKYKVIYSVDKFMRPKDVSLFENFDIAANAANVDLTQLTPTQVERLTEQQRKLYDNLISFDYLYTGKNIDILEFDMKMNLGLAYLQIATVTNTLRDQLQTVSTATTHIPQYDIDKLVRWGRPTQIPVFFGSQVRMPYARNKQNSSSNAEAAYTINKHASLEMLDATMRIHGNPYLLGTINRTTSPKNLPNCAQYTDPPDQNVDPQTRQANFRDWSRFPAFSKVNIRMPRNNDDVALFKTTSNNAQPDPNNDRTGAADFTREFWFTGYYYVIGIEHSFEKGEFTQVFSMIGIPQTSTFKTINKKGQNSSDFDIQKNINECYDGYVDPCAKGYDSKKLQSLTGQQPPTGTGSNSAAGSKQTTMYPQSKPATGLADNEFEAESVTGPTAAPPANLADANVINNSLDPSCIKGWNTASPEVRDAITSASNKYGVDTGFMAAMAGWESNGFNPNAVPINPKTGQPYSSARGLYQMTRGTWRGLSNKYGNELGLTGKTTTEIDNARYDPYKNAAGAALLAKENERILKSKIGNSYQPTNSDLYLAHFMGPSRAAKIIQADLQNPNTSPQQALGSSAYTSIVEANPPYAKYQTVHEWRAAAAKNLTRRYTCGVPVPQPKNRPSPSPQAQTSGGNKINTGTGGSVATGTQKSGVRITANPNAVKTTAKENVQRVTECPTKNQDKLNCKSCNQTPECQDDLSQPPSSEEQVKARTSSATGGLRGRV